MAAEKTTDSTETTAVESGDSDVLPPVAIDWIKYVAALFAIASVALAVFTLLLDIIDQDTLGVEQGGGTDATVADIVANEFMLATLAVVGIVFAVFIGAFLGYRLLEDDKTTMIAAAATAAVGVLVLWVLGGFLGTIFTEASEEFGDLLINGVGAAIGGAVAGAGGVWATRNLAPATLSQETETAEPTPATATDD